MGLKYKLRPGDLVNDSVGEGGTATVLRRCGPGEVDPSQYVEVRWPDGRVTTEPVWRFGRDCR